MVDLANQKSAVNQSCPKQAEQAYLESIVSICYLVRAEEIRARLSLVKRLAVQKMIMVRAVVPGQG